MSDGSTGLCSSGLEDKSSADAEAEGGSEEGHATAACTGWLVSDSVPEGGGKIGLVHIPDKKPNFHGTTDETRPF